MNVTDGRDGYGIGLLGGLAGWLAPSTIDRERAREMTGTVGRIRLAAVPLMAAYCLVAWRSGQGEAWWLLALAVVTVLQLLLRVTATNEARAVVLGLASLLLGAGWLGAAAALTGGVDSPFVVWMLFVVAVSPLGMSHRGHLLACGWMLACLAGVAATDPTGLRNDPLLVLAVMSLAVVLVPVGTRLIELDAAQRRALWRDPLTGALNRAALERRHSTLSEDGAGQTLIVFDLDRFKAINDMRGHPFGDRALQEAARVAADTVRDHDSVFRLGGEEFAILLAGADPERAWLVAERVRCAIRDARVDGVLVTASFGVASAGADRVPVSLPDLYEQADRAMYRAKEAGRDRVETA
ncbi:MAG: GGDEF domain-containing protein [Solirubrobacteraceae bacterium]|nr:GGDEF domain-containing protein [Solirubrobacteraceae bacterium]